MNVDDLWETTDELINSLDAFNTIKWVTMANL